MGPLFIPSRWDLAEPDFTESPRPGLLAKGGADGIATQKRPPGGLPGGRFFAVDNKKLSRRDPYRRCVPEECHIPGVARGNGVQPTPVACRC